MVDKRQLADDIDRLVERGRRARATVRRAGAESGGDLTEAVGLQGVEISTGVQADDWSTQRSIVYDQAMVNRWKTDCLRFFRETWGADAGPYQEFGTIVDRSGVMWRAIDPGLDLLGRLREQLTAEGRE